MATGVGAKPGAAITLLGFFIAGTSVAMRLLPDEGVDIDVLSPVIDRLFGSSGACPE